MGFQPAFEPRTCRIFILVSSSCITISHPRDTHDIKDFGHGKHGDRGCRFRMASKRCIHMYPCKKMKWVSGSDQIETPHLSMIFHSIPHYLGDFLLPKSSNFVTVLAIHHLAIKFLSPRFTVPILFSEVSER